MEETKSAIENMIGISSKSLSEMIDVNTVIGTPFQTVNGVQIIPFTKVTLGYLSGGGEYGESKTVLKDGKMFAGGVGNVLSIKPFGFLVDDGKSVRLLNISDDPINNLIEKAEEVLVNNFSDRDIKNAKNKP